MRLILQQRLLSFLFRISICGFQLSSSSIVTPRNLVSVTCLVIVPSITK